MPALNPSHRYCPLDYAWARLAQKRLSASLCSGQWSRRIFRLISRIPTPTEDFSQWPQAPYCNRSALHSWTLFTYNHVIVLSLTVDDSRGSQERLGPARPRTANDFGNFWLEQLGSKTQEMAISKPWTSRIFLHGPWRLSRASFYVSVRVSFLVSPTAVTLGRI